MITPDDVPNLAQAADLTTPEQRITALHAQSHTLSEHRVFALEAIRDPNDNKLKLVIGHPDGTMHIYPVADQKADEIHRATQRPTGQNGQPA